MEHRGHNFTKFKSVERICWECGYVISDMNGHKKPEEIDEDMIASEGFTHECPGVWHGKREPSPDFS